MKCRSCDGRGFFPSPGDDESDLPVDGEECPDCQGHGHVEDPFCSNVRLVVQQLNDTCKPGLPPGEAGIISTDFAAELLQETSTHWQVKMLAGVSLAVYLEKVTL